VTVGRFVVQRLLRIQADCKEECLAAHNKALAALGKKPLSLKSADLPAAYVMHDHLRLAAPDQASRLLKLRAERRLCHVIILGFAALAVLRLVHINSASIASWIVAEAVLLVSVVSCWSRQLRLERYFTNGTCLVWLALASCGKILPGGKDGSAPEENRQDIA